MTFLTVGMDIKTPKDKIVRDILEAIRKELQGSFDGLTRELEQEIRTSFKLEVFNSDEYDAMVRGSFGSELGIPDIASKLSTIIDVFSQGIQVSVKKLTRQGPRLRGGIRVTAPIGDYSSILNLDASNFTTEKGTKLEWLRWMLLEGDKIIVRDFNVAFNRRQFSRTGGAIMVPRTTARTRGWRVPPEFSGTVNNNFITRALDSSLPDIEKKVTDIVRRKL